MKQNKNENNNGFNKRCYGILIIKSENSNFNADFTGNPRRLPDENGTIYATDKALKYAIRRYWIDSGKDVFVWRSHKDNGNPRTRDERMNEMKSLFEEKYSDFKKLKDEYDSINSKKEKDRTDEEKKRIEDLPKIITSYIFSKCIDIKLFGVTYTGTGPVSLTGPVQFSYGINKLLENINLTNDILAPYADDPKDKQTSIGKDSKNLNAFYVYDFSINPQNILSHYETNEDIKNKMKITVDEIDLLKEAMRNAVTALDTTSKKDSENSLLLFIEMSGDSKEFLPAMKNLVEITKENKKTTIDLTKIDELIKHKQTGAVELYYNANITDVKLTASGKIKPTNTNM